MGREQGFSAATRLEPEASPAGVPAMRIVGITAIALAVSMVIQNAMFMATDAPGYGDPIEEVFAWHRENRTVVAIAVAQEALHIPLLLGFLTGLHGLVAGHGGATWSRLAVAAGATLSAIFALYSVLWIGVALSVGEHTEPNPTFELAWLLHAAAFALALPALGATFIGAALAAHQSRLTPSWQRLLGVAGGSLLLAAGAASLEIADGSPLLFVGLPGLALWIVWLLATGVRLVRARTTARPDTASTADATRG
ncbi:hypothetical protein PSET11_02943 [Arthrobacter ulcerisalmonis]|uniref:DUF4386 family protein n=3 Tax=Arthrobacter ulcerisalmonis TaxID=2483813 RepID=A0A3P5XR39_9MICC|nr:hypothetical protein PSET11_02943 [Arthrobacter ulcerisalmonis]